MITAMTKVIAEQEIAMRKFIVMALKTLVSITKIFDVEDCRTLERVL